MRHLYQWEHNKRSVSYSLIKRDCFVPVGDVHGVLFHNILVAIEIIAKV